MKKVNLKYLSLFMRKPDILCLQEYYFTNDENLPFETRNLILDSLGFPYYSKVFQKKAKRISLELLLSVNTLL